MRVLSSGSTHKNTSPGSKAVSGDVNNQNKLGPLIVQEKMDSATISASNDGPLEATNDKDEKNDGGTAYMLSQFESQDDARARSPEVNDTQNKVPEVTTRFPAGPLGINI